MHIGGPHQRKIDHAGADGGVGEAVDQDKAAGIAVLAIRIEGQRLGKGDIHITDLIQRQCPARQMVQGVDIDLVLEGRDLGWRRGGAQLQKILPSGQQFLVRHPQQMRRELVGNHRAGLQITQHIAA